MSPEILFYLPLHKPIFIVLLPDILNRYDSLHFRGVLLHNHSPKTISRLFYWLKFYNQKSLKCPPKKIMLTILHVGSVVNTIALRSLQSLKFCSNIPWIPAHTIDISAKLFTAKHAYFSLLSQCLIWGPLLHIKLY